MIVSPDDRISAALTGIGSRLEGTAAGTLGLLLALCLAGLAGQLTFDAVAAALGFVVGGGLIISRAIVREALERAGWGGPLGDWAACESGQQRREERNPPRRRRGRHVADHPGGLLAIGRGAKRVDEDAGRGCGDGEQRASPASRPWAERPSATHPWMSGECRMMVPGVPRFARVGLARRLGRGRPRGRRLGGGLR
jgi:hypothetical protein